MGFGDILARGAVEHIWDHAYENGDELLGDADDVENLARWRGERGLLARALLEAGGADEDGFTEIRCTCGGDRDAHRDGKGCEAWRPVEGRFFVHDLWDHAPDYGRERAEREAERRARGETISSVRSKAGRKGGKARAARAKATARQTEGTCQANGATPAPAPAPLFSLRSERRSAAPARSGTRRRKGEDPDPRHRPLRERLEAAYLDVRGSAYGFHGGRDARAVADLLRLSGGDGGEVERRWRRALADADRFRRCDAIYELSERKWNAFAEGHLGVAPPAKHVTGTVDPRALLLGREGT